MITKQTRKRKKDFIGNNYNMNSFSVRHKGRKNRNEIQMVWIGNIGPCAGACVITDFSNREPRGKVRSR